MSSSVKRIISAAIFIPILLYCILSTNSILLLLLISLIIFLGVLEFYSLASKKHIKPFKLIGVITAFFLVLVAYLKPTQFYFLSTILISPLLIGYFITLLMRRHFLEVGVTLAGVLYIGYLFSHIFLLRHLPNGNFFVCLLFLISWSTDSIALWIGLKFGRHKLVPTISPKKSVEGAIAGLVGAVLVSLLANLIPKYPINQIIILGLILGFCGQVGDLLESKMKRLAEVKDSNTWIPGHGGILDVFDSVIFNAPIIYSYVFFYL